MPDLDTVLVRYGEIGTKSSHVRGQMSAVLRQRVSDRLEYEEIEFDAVKRSHGRVIAENVSEPLHASEAVSELPGVSSASAAKKMGSEMSELEDAVEEFHVESPFAVDAKTTSTQLESPEIEKSLGSHVEDFTSASVDLEEPETTIYVEIRGEDAYISTEKLRGPDGFPVGSEGGFAALISGGIDSPVAAYEAMTRGADILPVYFYNKPYSAEDHLLRFREVVEKLERFHPSRKWYVYVVDMETINHELEKIGKGRMLVHRQIMFSVAERIAEKEGLKGVVTGESIGQKSSQTPDNLKVTSSKIDLPVHRPLLTLSKPEITEKARELGTFELANIRSGCRDLSPESPSTESSINEIDELWEQVDGEKLVEKAFRSAEKREIENL